MPVVASATLEVTPVLSGAQQSLTQQLTGASVEAGDKAGQESGSKFASSMAKKIAVGSAAVAGAVTAVGGALVGTASKTAAYGDSIDKASQKLGVSSTFYQEWEAVLQHSGTSMDSMSGAFKKLATASQDASADQQAAFERLGMSMDEVSQMSPEELFTNVISGLQGMEEGTERTAVATELLGKGSMEMGALLNTSAEDTQAMIDKVHELGGVMDEDAIKASAQFQDSLQDMQTSFEGVKNGIGAKLLPVLSDFMDRVSDFVANTDLTPLIDTIGQAVDALADFISNLDIEAVGTTFQNVVSAIGSVLGLAWSVISTVFSAIKDGLGTITDALNGTGTNWSEVWNGISSVVQTVAGIIAGVIGIIAQVIAGVITQVQTQGTVFNLVWQGICAVVQSAGTIIQGVISFVSALISTDWSAIWTNAQSIVSSIFSAISAFIGNILNTIRTTFTSIWNSIRTTISTVVNNIRSTIANVFSAIYSKISGIMTSVKTTISGAWETAKKTVSDAVTNVKETIKSGFDTAYQTVTRIFGDIKTAIKDKLDAAKKVVTDAIDTIKKKFKFDWSLPDLKLPHIKVDKYIDVPVLGRIPDPHSIRVEWYKKAGQTPYMFQNATLFGAGEAGDEILYGREALLNDIREATSGGGYTQNITINSPKQLNPSEVARQTKLQTRSMVMRMRTT